MSDKLIVNSNIGISSTPESAINTMHVLAAEFKGAVTNALNIKIPGVDKILNKGLIGSGDEWASKADPDYAMATGITFQDRLNSTQFAILAARFLGGTITDTEVSTGVGVYDHVIEMQLSSADPQLKSSTVGFKLGALDWLMGGLVGNVLSVTATNGAAPNYSAQLDGTGMFGYMASQTPSLVLPKPVDQDYVGQRSQTDIQFNDGTTFDMTAVGRADNYNFNFNNNLVAGDKRMGDSLVDPTDDNSGAVVGRLTRGDRTVGVGLGLYVADDKRGYLAHLSNTTVSNFKYKSTGNKKIGSSGVYYHEVEITIPLATITTPSLGGNTKGILTFNFEALFNQSGTEAGPVKMRIRNTSPTLT